MTDNEQGYTPTESTLREVYWRYRAIQPRNLDVGGVDAEFDRWLAAHDAATLAAHRVTLEAESREALADWFFSQGEDRDDAVFVADNLLASGVVSVVSAAPKTEPVQDDYEAGYNEGFHHGLSTPTEPVQVTTPTETDEVIAHEEWRYSVALGFALRILNEEQGVAFLRAWEEHLPDHDAPVAPPTEEAPLRAYTNAPGMDFGPNSTDRLYEFKPVVPVDALGFPTQEGATFTAQFRSGVTGGRFIVLANRHVRLPGVGTFTIGGIDPASIEDVRPADGRSGQ